jgi:hypothetical protein
MASLAAGRWRLGTPRCRPAFRELSSVTHLTTTRDLKPEATMADARPHLEAAVEWGIFLPTFTRDQIEGPASGLKEE